MRGARQHSFLQTVGGGIARNGEKFAFTQANTLTHVRLAVPVTWEKAASTRR